MKNTKRNHYFPPIKNPGSQSIHYDRANVIKWNGIITKCVDKQQKMLIINTKQRYETH